MSLTVGFLFVFNQPIDASPRSVWTVLADLKTFPAITKTTRLDGINLHESLEAICVNDSE